MKPPTPVRGPWLDHEHFLTYQIADFTEAVATEPFAFISGLLQNLVANDGVTAFLAHWPKYSALHRFIAFIADELFDRHANGLGLINLEPDARKPKWVLSVDAALVRYGLAEQTFEPKAEDREGRREEYGDYFSELRWGESYGHLLGRIADEVFFVMFTNRVALYRLNRLLAMYVRDFDPECLEDGLARFFRADGQLARRAPPQWARKAVFFRERGHCARCGTNLTGLLSTLPVNHFDHMVPLAEGGLNDVTNLQLLCARCNQRKGKRTEEPSRRLQHWYRM